ncbi:MAG: LPS export ABC transporter periplasmic protein LptC [Rhodospirillales bacterium]
MNMRATRRHSPGYSRFVSMMKYLLPMVAAVLVIMVVAWPYLSAKDTHFRIGFSSLKPGDREDPAMINPRYLTTDKSSQLFSITADLAKNLLNGNAEVELEMPKADIILEDGTWLVLTAETGIFGRESKTLDLLGDVNLFHDSGYEFNTSKVSVDLAKGIAEGNEQVKGQGPFGSLTAEGFRLKDKGKTIEFTGKSKLVMFPGVGKPLQ